ncbi:hypothetical protein KEM52_003953, partial [Ascosphaera acerosa]
RAPTDMPGPSRLVSNRIQRWRQPRAPPAAAAAAADGWTGEGRLAPEEREIVWRWTDDAGGVDVARMAELTGRGEGTFDGSFVRELRVGDAVAVWAKARFPGWRNHVRHLSVRMYWAV